jgi:hypothetical protein
VRAQPKEPPQDVRDVRPEHAAVRVQLVHHDHPELLEQLEPLGVVGEDRRVEHVRVGDHDLAGLPDGGADRGGGVAVVAGRRDLEARVLHQLPELRDLVLPQGLGGEEEEGPGGRVLGERLEDRHRVAQRLAGGGGGDDNDVLARVHGLDRVRLVGVRALDSAPRQALADPRVQPRRPVPVLGRARLADLVVDDAARERRLLEQLLQHGPGAGGGVGAHAISGLDFERMSELDGSLRQPRAAVCHLGCHRAGSNRVLRPACGLHRPG